MKAIGFFKLKQERGFSHWAVVDGDRIPISEKQYQMELSNGRLFKKVSTNKFTEDGHKIVEAWEVAN